MGLPTPTRNRRQMLGPFDRYRAIQIGTAAAIVGIVVLIGWLQGPPRR